MKPSRGKGGRDLGGGKTLIKGNAAGPKSMRCGRCQRLIAPSKDNAGKPIYQCTCGSVYRSTSM